MPAQYTGLNDQIALKGAGVLGFALDAAGDPEIWTKLTSDQQAWIVSTLVKLNDLIVKSTGSRCPSWAPAIDRATECFQAWWNWSNANVPSVKKLRTDGVFDQDTLNALISVAKQHPTDFPKAYPRFSTGAMVGLYLAGAGALGGVVYLATRKRSRRQA